MRSLRPNTFPHAQTRETSTIVVMHQHHLVLQFHIAGNMRGIEPEDDLKPLRLFPNFQIDGQPNLVVPETTLSSIVHLQRPIARSTAIPHVRLFIATITANLRLLVAINESILSSHSLNLSIRQEGHIETGFDVRDVLEVSLSEDEIDFLQGTLFGFWVEEVDDGDETGVDDGEEKISSPVDVGDHDGGDHDDKEVEEPVGDGRYCVGLCSGSERVNLGRIQPWKWQPSCAEESNVCEESNTGTLR